MAKRQKRVPIERTSSIEGAVADGLGDVQSLKEEMESWKDNMEGNSMEHLPKYEEVSECCDALEEHADSEPAIPGTFPEGLEDSVRWIEPMERRRGRATRAERLDQAMAGISAAKDAVETFLDEHDDEHACWEGADRSEWETYREELDNVVSGLEGVSFPGMY